MKTLSIYQVHRTSDRRNIETIAVVERRDSEGGEYYQRACLLRDLRRFRKSALIISTPYRRRYEIQLTASMSASTPANPSKMAEGTVNYCVFPPKISLLIRFSRLGRESNTFSAAEAIVS